MQGVRGRRRGREGGREGVREGGSEGEGNIQSPLNLKRP